MPGLGLGEPPRAISKRTGDMVTMVPNGKRTTTTFIIFHLHGTVLWGVLQGRAMAGDDPTVTHGRL